MKVQDRNETAQPLRPLTPMQPTESVPPQEAIQYPHPAPYSQPPQYTEPKPYTPQVPPVQSAQSAQPVQPQRTYLARTEISGERPRRGGFMLPALLIGVGLLFLLNTLEIIDWRIWGGLWRLWPLILVAVGLEILVGRRSAAASAIIAVGMLVVMAAALWFWSVQPYTSLSGTTNIDQPLQGAKSAQVTINSGVGDLNVAPLAGSQSLVTGVVNTMNNEVLTQDFHMTGSTAYYTLASKSNWSLPFSDNTFGNHTWNLNLNSTVPTNLSINTGVGNADLNLEKLNLSRLDVAAGAGNTIVTLPAQGVLGANIRAGVGDLMISVPSGAAARIEIVSGLGNKVVPANYEHNGNVYQSPDYSTSKNKVDLHVDAGVGNITVR